MTAALTVLAGAYLLLIALHVWMIRRHRRRGAYEPRLALWVAARLGPLPDPSPAGARLARHETRAVHRLMAGDLDPDEYRAMMATVAALEALERPVRVPGG